MSITSTIWLYLLREGGRWSASEIASGMDLDDPTVRGALKSMEDSGAVMKYRRDTKAHVEYGVTIDCVVPPGVTLADLNRVGVNVKPRPVAMQWRPV